MSYDKNTWQTGDVVTSEKLNHMEDGIASAGGGGLQFILTNVTGDEQNASLDIKPSDILESASGGLVKVPIAILPTGETPAYLMPVDIQSILGQWEIAFTYSGERIAFAADTFNDYFAMGDK